MQRGEVRLDDALAEVVDRGHDEALGGRSPVCKKSLNSLVLVVEEVEEHGRDEIR